MLLDAFARIDAINAEGPDDRELLYSRRMTERLDRLEPDASDALRIAVRAQHIARWRIPRSDYPEGRAGYKRWRATLARMHADVCAEILVAVGYGDDTIARVRVMLTKARLKQDPEVQTLEDVACLVFLEHYAIEFAAKHPEDKVVDILRKTWTKVSDRGHRAALALDLPAALRALIDRALA